MSDRLEQQIMVLTCGCSMTTIQWLRGLLDVSVPRYGEWFPGHEPVSSKRVGSPMRKAWKEPLQAR